MTRMTILVSGLLGILCAVGLYPDDARGQDVILGGVRPRIILEKPAVPAAVVAPQSSGEKPELPPVDPTGFEARLNDDSRLKLSLADETIEVTGRYGTLRIPASEVLRIEFATRINPETRQQIEKALAELGSPEEQVRGNAALQLGRLRHLAYPAIAQAAKDSQSPAGQQAAMLIAKYYGTVSEKDFAPRETDMIYTVDDAIAGMIVAPSLKVRTAQFGELTLKVADARSLRLQSLPAEDAESDTLGQVLTDPGNLASFYANPGQVLRFRLVGEVGREIWGTDVYTADSALSSAAVHAGVLQAGSTGVVKVKIVDPPAHFRGSSRNGARSNSYGAYPKAYQFVK